jgi:hypothetical protein
MQKDNPALRGQNPRMFRIIFFLALASSVAFASNRDPDRRAEANELLERGAPETDLFRRLDLFSRSFVGLPYGKSGPLGEGPGGRYDQDPLYRFDTFDCTTYVETVLALARARDVDEFEEHLDRIRYEDGVVDYLKRNHFTDLQWIPETIRQGYLSELTDLVAPEGELRTAAAQINFPGWLRAHQLPQIVLPRATPEERRDRLSELRERADEFSVRTARVPYVSIRTILDDPGLLDRLPAVTVVNFVRPNWDLTASAGTHLNISHQGFLFRSGKRLILRHASTQGAVEDVRFLEYLEVFRNHATLKGVHFMWIR